MPYQIQKKRGSRMVGFLTVAILGAAAVTGTTYANLTTKTVTEADSEYVKSDYTPSLRFNYFHAENNEPIEADVTPQEATRSLVFTKYITNDSALPAHAVLYAEGFDVANIPAVLLDTTTVKMVRSDLPGGTISVSLREFVTTGIFFSKIIPADTNFNYKITMDIPTSAANDYSSIVGAFEEKFSTGVTFSQVINNTSPLFTYFSKTSNFIREIRPLGGNVYIVDKSLIAGVVGEKP